MLREYTESYIYLSFVYFSICWVLFHTMLPFAFVFCWAYGLAEGRLILCQPSADCSLCGGSLWGGASRKASPERGGARRRRAEGFVPPRRTVAAALSAAVTTTAQQEPPHLSGGTKPAEAHPPNASRSSGEGVWGGGASLREAASSPESPPPHQLFAIACSRKSREMHQIPAAPTSV